MFLPLKSQHNQRKPRQRWHRTKNRAPQCCSTAFYPTPFFSECVPRRSNPEKIYRTLVSRPMVSCRSRPRSCRNRLRFFLAYVAQLRPRSHHARLARDRVHHSSLRNRRTPDRPEFPCRISRKRQLRLRVARAASDQRADHLAWKFLDLKARRRGGKKSRLS